MTQVLKFGDWLLLVVILTGFGLNSLPIFANVNPEAKSIVKKANTSGEKVEVKDYSFRPLLIHGKKDVSKQIQEMKVETGAVVESEVFFVDQDFKKRIFRDEGLSQ